MQNYVYNRIIGDFRPTAPRIPAEPSFRDINIRPVSFAWRSYGDVERQPAYRSAVANAAYIWRDSSPIDNVGPMPATFEKRRFELVSGGLLLPAKAPVWACDPYRIWAEADEATAAIQDPTAASAWHVVITLPPKLRILWSKIVGDFAHKELVSKGAAVAWAIHACESAAEGAWLIHPHAHLVVSARHWRHDHRQGMRHPNWLTNYRQHARLWRWKNHNKHAGFT